MSFQAMTIKPAVPRTREGVTVASDAGEQQSVLDIYDKAWGTLLRGTTNLDCTDKRQGWSPIPPRR